MNRERLRRCHGCGLSAPATGFSKRSGYFLCAGCLADGVVRIIEVPVRADRTLRVCAYEGGDGRRILLALVDRTGNAAGLVAGLPIEASPSLRSALAELEVP